MFSASPLGHAHATNEKTCYSFTAYMMCTREKGPLFILIGCLHCRFQIKMQMG